VDRVKIPGIDTVLDLDAPFSWPWEAGSVSEIEAKDVFEHLHNPVHFMTECHRVLAPGGTLHIRTPHMSSPDSWDDPTHVRHLTERSFDYWIPGTVYFEHHNAAYGGVSFACPDLRIDRGTIDVTLKKLSVN
jgi:SAM-dependent methyltransferase